MYLKLNGSGRVLWELLERAAQRRRARCGAWSTAMGSTRPARPTDVAGFVADFGSEASSGTGREPTRSNISARAVSTATRDAGSPCHVRLPLPDLFTTLHAGVVIVLVEATCGVFRCPGSAGCSASGSTSLRRPPDAERIRIRDLPPRAARQMRCTRRVADAWPFSQGPCLRRALVAGHLLRDLDPPLRLGFGQLRRQGCSPTRGLTPRSAAGGHRELQPLPADADPRDRMNESSVVYTQCGVRLAPRSSWRCRSPKARGGTSRSGAAQRCTTPPRPPQGDVIAVYDNPGGENWYTATRTESGYRMRFRECGEFEISTISPTS